VRENQKNQKRTQSRKGAENSQRKAKENTLRNLCGSAPLREKALPTPEA
jgi:hypothetical protein